MQDAESIVEGNEVICRNINRIRRNASANVNTNKHKKFGHVRDPAYLTYDVMEVYLCCALKRGMRAGVCGG